MRFQKIKYMGKLVSCFKNSKVFCVCNQHNISCLEPDPEEKPLWKKVYEKVSNNKPKKKRRKK